MLPRYLVPTILFDKFFNESAVYPKINLTETETDIIIRADLPGFTKDNVEITIDNNILTIKGKTEYVKEENVYFSERYSREFVRTIEIPKTVDSGNTKAKLHNGMLIVIMPKQEKDLTKIIKVEKNA